MARVWTRARERRYDSPLDPVPNRRWRLRDHERGGLGCCVWIDHVYLEKYRLNTCKGNNVDDVGQLREERCKVAVWERGEVKVMARRDEAGQGGTRFDDMRCDVIGRGVGRDEMERDGLEWSGMGRDEAGQNGTG